MKSRGLKWAVLLRFILFCIGAIVLTPNSTYSQSVETRVGVTNESACQARVNAAGSGRNNTQLIDMAKGLK